MWEKGAKSLIFMPRGTLPLIFGLRQKFIYQNLAKNFRKVMQKSQIDRFEKKSIFNSRRGGVWFGEIFCAGFVKKFPVVAMHDIKILFFPY